MKFAHLVARVEADPATAPGLPAENQIAPAEGQPKPVESQPDERGKPTKSAPSPLAPHAESQPAPVEGQPKPAESQPANERGKPAESAPPTPAPTQEQNQGNKDQNQNGNQNQSGNQNGNQDQNQNGNKDNNRNGNNNNNNINDINQIIQNGVQNGNVLQGIFTPAITGIINNMGLGQNVNVQAIQGLNFPNQIVVLNQLQQLQTLMQFNIVQRQQVVTFVGQGISNNGVKIALLKRDVDDLPTVRTVAEWDT